MTKIELSRISQQRVFKQAVDQLKEAILSGQFQNGERLPTESDLCSILGVGRSTVREAIRVLEADGLVEVQRGSGTFVVFKPALGATRGDILRWLAKREDTVIQILEVRLAIEWLTASLAAINRTHTTIEVLRSIINQQWDAIGPNIEPENIDKLAELDIRFHLVISEASKNEIAHEIVSHIVPAFSETNRAILWVSKGVLQSMKEHEAILAGIQAQEPSQAEKAMREHIDRVKKEICEFLKEECG